MDLRNSTFRLIDRGWDRELAAGLAAGADELCVVCPFIKFRAAERLLAGSGRPTVRIITRFSLADMQAGVHDLAALRRLRERGAKIRGIRHLHAKLYLFGRERAIVTSANLTEAALRRNLEFGFVARDPAIVSTCRGYFETLWRQAGPDLDTTQLDGWERLLADAAPLANASAAATPVLPDFGADAGFGVEENTESSIAARAHPAFVKLFGEANGRRALNRSILEVVDHSGCHLACTYPKSKRPRSVEDGSVMFLARLVKEPNDIVIFGRAIGRKHVPGRDEASAAEIGRRKWKERWPNYVRVRDPEFVAGTLSNGVLLSDLMNELEAEAFASTQRHARSGTGNVDPRRAFRQQPQVELSPEGFAWLTTRLDGAFASHGKLSAAELAGLDWPSEPDESPR